MDGKAETFRKIIYLHPPEAFVSSFCKAKLIALAHLRVANSGAL
jgi:hypothetical protein